MITDDRLKEIALSIGAMPCTPNYMHISESQLRDFINTVNAEECEQMKAIIEQYKVLTDAVNNMTGRESLENSLHNLIDNLSDSIISGRHYDMDFLIKNYADEIEQERASINVKEIESYKADAELGQLVRSKMISGNSVPVSRCTITNSEIDALASRPENLGQQGLGIG